MIQKSNIELSNHIFITTNLLKADTALQKAILYLKITSNEVLIFRAKKRKN
jgi:hypothetical protein